MRSQYLKAMLLLADRRVRGVAYLWQVRLPLKQRGIGRVSTTSMAADSRLGCCGSPLHLLIYDHVTPAQVVVIISTHTAWAMGGWAAGVRPPGATPAFQKSPLTTTAVPEMCVCGVCALRFSRESAILALKTQIFFWPRGADGHRLSAK